MEQITKEDLVKSIKSKTKINENTKEQAYKKALEEINEYVTRAKYTMYMAVPSPKIDGVFYFDDRQEIIANMLKQDGFTVKRESKKIAGIWQDPIYYVYF